MPAAQQGGALPGRLVWTMKRQEVKQFVAVATNVESRIVEIRRQSVLLDADVADLYGVETRRINEAVRNNPDKFPSDYMFALTKDEAEDLRSKISTTKLSPKSRVLPKAFTEKGLYMLATILKSRKATSTTFAIIETFAKVRNLKRELVELHKESDSHRRSAKMRHFGETLTDIVMPDLTALGTVPETALGTVPELDEAGIVRLQTTLGVRSGRES